MKSFAMSLLALVLVAGAVIYGLAQAPERPAGPPRAGGPEPAHREFHVLPPRVAEQLRLSDDQLKQIAELDKEVQAKMAKILTTEQMEGWNRLGPPGPPGPPQGDAGPPRDGDRSPGPAREGDRRAGPPPRDREDFGPPRDGERPAGLPRDGERRASPPRDREDFGPPRDGERPAGPPRDGERRASPPRDREDFGPPRDGERPAGPPYGPERGEYGPPPRGPGEQAGPPGNPPGPPPHGPDGIGPAVMAMRLDEKQQATVDELVKQHHEKVRKAVEDLRTNLVKQIKEAVGDSKGADFERVLNEHAAPPRVPEGPPGPPGPPPGAPPR